MKVYDYIIVGSGMNSLVCAATLSKKGNKVLVLERESIAGGCIKSGEVTVPGFNHDLMSGFYPEFLAGGAYSHLGKELHEHGLEFLNTDYPTASILPGGRYFILGRDRQKNINMLNNLCQGDGDTFSEDMDDFGRSAHITFGMLANEVPSVAIFKLIFKEIRKTGVLALTDFFGKASRSARNWVSQYKGEEARACLFPWVLHAGMDIDGAMSGYMGRVFTFAIEAAGMPVVKGGSENIVKAFSSFLQAQGSEIKTEIDVKQVIVEKARATGVSDRNGAIFSAKKGVICNVTPQALYGKNGIIPSSLVPAQIAKNSDEYKYGRGNMIIHLALESAPQWPHSDLSKVAMLHISDGLYQTTQSLADVKNGLLPRRATIAVGQKAAVDPSRVPDGKFSLWLQLHEVPRNLLGDAAGAIKIENGWTRAIGEAYADRVLKQLEEHAAGLSKLILGRNVYTPADLEKMNINLVGGDPYSGANTLDQFLLWRPLRGLKGHRTPVKNVYHIGASTHPGPGLGGGSGFLVGQSLR